MSERTKRLCLAATHAALDAASNVNLENMDERGEETDHSSYATYRCVVDGREVRVAVVVSETNLDADGRPINVKRIR